MKYKHKHTVLTPIQTIRFKVTQVKHLNSSQKSL